MKKEKLKMSPYVKCPKCGRNDFQNDSARTSYVLTNSIIVSEWETDDDLAWRECRCKCGFEWREMYSFSMNQTLDNCIQLDDDGNEID
jgi:predicted nucleic-acid-binding Zn-ribbon protein